MLLRWWDMPGLDEFDRDLVFSIVNDVCEESMVLIAQRDSV